jgi:hypothetical protein
LAGQLVTVAAHEVTV